MTSITFSEEISLEEAVLLLWKATKPVGLGALHSPSEPTIEQILSE